MHKGNCNYLYHTVNSCKLSCTWAYMLFPCPLKTSLLKLTELLAPQFGSQTVLTECNPSVSGLWVFPQKILLEAFFLSSVLLFSCYVKQVSRSGNNSVSLPDNTPSLGKKIKVNQEWVWKHLLIMPACLGDLVEPCLVMWYLISAASLLLLIFF